MVKVHVEQINEEERLVKATIKGEKLDIIAELTAGVHGVCERVADDFDKHALLFSIGMTLVDLSKK